MKPIINPVVGNNTDIDLVIYVSVAFYWASYSEGMSLDIDFWIDDEPVSIGKSFPSSPRLKKPDSFQLKLSPGRHLLRAESQQGEAVIETSFELSEQTRYMDLSLNYYPKDSPLWNEYQPETNPEFASPGFLIEQQAKDFGWR